MSIQSLCLIASILVTCSAGHTLHLGRTCPNVQPFPNLSIDKVLGVWYVTYKFDTGNTCLVWNITKSTTSSERLYVTETRQLYILDAFGIDHKHSITGALDTPNLEIPARLRIHWPDSISGKADFTIFDTDYDKYMAIFECNRAGLLHRRSVTVLSRTPVIDDLSIKRVKRLLDSADVPHGALDKISHEFCRNDAKTNWHMKGKVFGILPMKEEIRDLGHNIQDYDISEIEIIGDGISEVQSHFRGS